MDGETLNDWIQLGSTVNTAAMDWYALSHDQPLPSQSALERTLGVDFGAVSPQFGLSIGRGISGQQILITVAVIAVAFWLWKKT
jgi:hypothetical protein